jgi:hypothetical protein
VNVSLFALGGRAGRSLVLPLLGVKPLCRGTSGTASKLNGNRFDGCRQPCKVADRLDKNARRLGVFLPGFELATVATAILEKRKKMRFVFPPLWEVNGAGCRVAGGSIIRANAQKADFARLRYSLGNKP